MVEGKSENLLKETDNHSPVDGRNEIQSINY